MLSNHHYLDIIIDQKYYFYSFFSANTLHSMDMTWSVKSWPKKGEHKSIRMRKVHSNKSKVNRCQGFLDSTSWLSPKYSFKWLPKGSKTFRKSFKHNGSHVSTNTHFYCYFLDCKCLGKGIHHSLPRTNRLDSFCLWGRNPLCETVWSYKVWYYCFF